MKKILFIISLIICINPVFAANWQSINDNGQKILVDIQSMTKNGSHYFYWVKFSKGVEEYKMYIESDCANAMTGTQKTLRYKNGKLLETKNIFSDLSPIVPDSRSEKIHNFICKFYEEDLKIQEQKQREEQAQAEQKAKQKAKADLINNTLNTGLNFLYRY